jgi:hypothetical protein
MLVAANIFVWRAEVRGVGFVLCVLCMCAAVLDVGKDNIIQCLLLTCADRCFWHALLCTCTWQLGNCQKEFPTASRYLTPSELHPEGGH